MRVPYNYLPDQYRNIDPYLEDIRELVRSTEFTLGPYVDKFERRFADYIGIKHVISTNNGTDALILCLKALGVGVGDEVITVANTFYATAGAIVAVGARPVFVDCDDRYQIDVNLVEDAISPKTRAILPVHWGGCSPDMNALLEISRRRGIPLVEDACPAVGAKVDGRFAGTFGRINAFSMHPLKPLNVWGDGGMVATDDDELAAYLRIYRNHGMTDRNTIEMWGINARLQPLQAIVGMRQLDIMEEIIQARIENARLLDAGLAPLKDSVSLPHRPSGNREAYQLYLACCKKRNQLLAYLIEHEVEAKVHYPVPLHLQKPGRELGYKVGDFPNAERQAQEIITIPSHQHLSEEQIRFAIEMISTFYA